MFKQRSRSLDRSNSKSRESFINLEGDKIKFLDEDKGQQDSALMAEYEALIDTLTQKLSVLEQRDHETQQQHREEEALKEQVISTLEKKLKDFKATDGLKEQAITTLEGKVQFLSNQLENATSQLENQTYLAQSRLRHPVIPPVMAHMVVPDHADPQTLLAARKLLKEVSQEFPKLTQETTHLFLPEARLFVKNYMEQWSNLDLQLDVFLTLLGAAHPDKKNTLQRLKNEASTPDSFLVAIANHYGGKTNYLVDEESFNAKAPMGSFLQSKDYGGWIDHLRALSDRYLGHLSELEKERAVLKQFVKNVGPNNTHEDCFTELGQTEANDLDSPLKIRSFLNKLKTKADIRSLLADRTKTASISAVDAPPATVLTNEQCDNCGSATHFSISCPQTHQGYIPLAQRSEQDRRQYLESYDWTRWLCPQRRLDQRCNNIHDCTKQKFRHLLTNSENKQRALGRLPLPGTPCSSAAEALADDNNDDI